MLPRFPLIPPPLNPGKPIKNPRNTLTSRRPLRLHFVPNSPPNHPLHPLPPVKQSSHNIFPPRPSPRRGTNPSPFSVSPCLCVTFLPSTRRTQDPRNSPKTSL